MTDKQTAWEKIRDSQGLGEDASDEDVYKAILAEKKAKDDLLTALADKLEKLEAKVDAQVDTQVIEPEELNKQVTQPDAISIQTMFEKQQELQERLNVVEKEKEQMIIDQKEAKINSIIDSAIAEGRASDSDRGHWLILAHANFESFDGLIKSQPIVRALSQSQSSRGYRDHANQENITYNQLEISGASGVTPEEIASEIKRRKSLNMRKMGGMY